MKNITILLLMILLLGLASCNRSQTPAELPQNSERLVIDETKPPKTELTPGSESAPEQKSQRESHIRDHYDMELSLDIESNRITGLVRVTLLNYSDNVWHSVCFRDYNTPILDSFGSYVENNKDNSWFSRDVLKAYLAKEFSSGISDAMDIQTGKHLTVETDETDASIVFIELETPLEPNDIAEIELLFAADIPPGSYRYSYLTLSSGISSYELANFYPILAVYEDGTWVTHPDIGFGESFYSKCADYNVKLSVPDGYTVAASGTEDFISSDSNGSVWNITAENMRDFTVTVSNCLSVISGEWNGVQVNSYYYDYYDGSTHINHKQAGEDILNAALESIKTYTTLFGDYPYCELDIVESAIMSLGMENCGLVRISPLTSDSIMKRPLQQQPVNVVAHEVAHGWFYAVIGNDQYTESWMDESFATFATLLYKRSYMTADEFEAEINLESPPVYIDLPLDAYAKNGSYDEAYNSGAAFLWKLMSEMGEEVFFEMMRDYYDAFQFKEAKTSDFVSLVYIWTNDNVDIKSIINQYLSSQ